jgi:hypothetical protein
MTRPKTKKIPTAHEKKNVSHFIQNNTLLKNVKMFTSFPNVNSSFQPI